MPAARLRPQALSVKRGNRISLRAWMPLSLAPTDLNSETFHFLCQKTALRQFVAFDPRPLLEEESTIPGAN